MKLDFCVSHNYTQRDLLLLLPTSSSSTSSSFALPPSSYASTTTIALKFYPKHVKNKNKTKHTMKISHISFI
jgi:hypothetical protein